MKYQEIRKAPSLLHVVTVKVNIFEWIDTRIGKEDGRWSIWEFTTGRPIASYFKTRRGAIERARNVLESNGKENTIKAIARWEKLNSYENNT
jgi:hypothetical protein